MRIKTSGCGCEGSESTLEDALWQFSGPIICYQCRGTHNTVDMTEGCGQHTDTKLTTLIFNGLAFVAQLYYKECKTLLGKNITLPHTNSLQNSPTQPSTFPLTVSQALAMYPWVQTKCKAILEELLDGRHLSQFTRLVKLLLGSILPVAAEGASSRAAINVTFQVE